MSHVPIKSNTVVSVLGTVGTQSESLTPGRGTGRRLPIKQISERYGFDGGTSQETKEEKNRFKNEIWLKLSPGS
jgi:hypothetical protein